MSSLLQFLLMLLMIALPTGIASSAEPSHCKVSVPKSVKGKAGDSINVPVKFKLDKKWYIYGFTMMINAEGIGPQQTDVYFTDSTGMVKHGTVIAPKPHTKYDESFEMDVHSYKGSFTCTLPITIDEKASKGKIQFPIEVTYQLCDGSMCLPPTTISLPFAVIVK
ncbi:MAG: protein-disulfide reductase DsbD N-terminal domain-containing protein [Candidatus Kapaibacteriota bacterium]